jgi:serpin B
MLSPVTRLVLANAIYFNGKWALPFEKESTHDDAFNLLDGSIVTVPMMSQTENLQYAAGDGYQAAALPYRETDMSMVFVLPDRGRFAEIEGSLSAEFMADLVAKLESQRVWIKLPKFSFESSFGLTDTLSDMGMPNAFDEADFSGMTGKRDLFISDILHKAFVAVDEEGTEAAAATVVMMELSARVEDDLIEMLLDRPFLFFIRDNDTGTILFAGRLMNPEG